MYARSIAMYGFKCFGKTQVDLHYPGRSAFIAPAQATPRYPNINLILGDNGGGKSSVLRAIAIAALAPAIKNAGFVPYRLVRRDSSGTAVDGSFLKLLGIFDSYELNTEAVDVTDGGKQRGTEERPKDFLAKLKSYPKRQIDELSLESTPENPISELIFDDSSPAFFVVGYGATRRIESGNFSTSGEDRRRGRRYQRVASLFEDHVSLRPLQSWFPMLPVERQAEVIALINKAMPDNLRFQGVMEDDDYIFEFDGIPTPLPALSDGYKAFVGWVSDLIGHMASVAGTGPLQIQSGIVLIDEIDLHLHPAWQRDVIAKLAETFPALQFVMTSHSPLVAAAVQSTNVVVTGAGDDGLPTLERMDESLFGRGVEAVLLSPYFGLDSARPLPARRETSELAARVSQKQGGDVNAAEEFLRRLAEPIKKLEDGKQQEGASDDPL